MNRHKQSATPVSIVALLLVGFLLNSGCERPPAVPGVNTVSGVEETAPSPRLTEETAADTEVADYDPWQPFNERMFWFNHSVLDRYLLKPAATGWSKIMPEFGRRSIGHMFTNLEMPRRLVNNLLQARPLGAGRELVRFVVNTTAGVAGFLDIATMLHIEASDADAGQTLAMYHVAAGPYLVLPTMPPGTVRDAIGRGVDGVLDPIGFVLPFFGNRAKALAVAINDRSLNLKLYADVEDSVLDLYSASRNAYLQRRRRSIQMAIVERHQQWLWVQFRPTETALKPHEENPA